MKSTTINDDILKYFIIFFQFIQKPQILFPVYQFSLKQKRSITLCRLVISRQLKTWKQLKTLNRKIRTYCQDFRMEFGIIKYGKLIRRTGKRETTERMELPTKKTLERFDRRKIKINFVRSNKQRNRKNKKPGQQKIKKSLKTKFYCRNLIKEINTFPVLPVRNSK